MIHELKTWPDPFRAIELGRKRAEFRFDDRGFGVGDTLRLREWHPNGLGYSGREINALVTDIVRGPLFGIPGDYVMMSIAVDDARDPRCQHDWAADGAGDYCRYCGLRP